MTFFQHNFFYGIKLAPEWLYTISFLEIYSLPSSIVSSVDRQTICLWLNFLSLCTHTFQLYNLRQEEIANGTKANSSVPPFPAMSFIKFKKKQVTCLDWSGKLHTVNKSFSFSSQGNKDQQQLCSKLSEYYTTKTVKVTWNLLVRSIIAVCKDSYVVYLVDLTEWEWKW